MSPLPLPLPTVTYEDNNSQQQMHLYQEEYKFLAEDNAGMVWLGPGIDRHMQACWAGVRERVHVSCDAATGVHVCVVFHPFPESTTHPA